MTFKIEKIAQLNSRMDLMGGDEFRLYIDGKLAHAQVIRDIKVVTHYAIVRIDGGLGYFIGDERLQESLEKIQHTLELEGFNV